MDPPKTGPLNQPPPAHNVSVPSQYPPPQGMPMVQAIPSGYNIPKPAHTGSIGMVKSQQIQGMQSGGQAKPVSNIPEKSFPMTPPKSATPPNHSPIPTSSMPKITQISSIPPSVGSKVGCMAQPQQSYIQFPQRLNPQMHFQGQTAPQNVPMHTNQSQINAHNMPPYPQTQIQKGQFPSQSIPVNKPDSAKGPTPPIPDLISLTKPTASQPLPSNPIKIDAMAQCQMTLAKTTQNISVPKEAQRPYSNSNPTFVPTSPPTLQISSESKPINSPVPTGKVVPGFTKSEVSKSTLASDTGSIPKKFEGTEINVSQEQSVFDKSDRTVPNVGANQNGVSSKPQLKTATAVLSQSNESTESKSIGDCTKKLIPTQPSIAPKAISIPSSITPKPVSTIPSITTKTISTTPSMAPTPVSTETSMPSKPVASAPSITPKIVSTSMPKISLSSGVTVTKAPVSQLKPAAAMSVSISKSCQQTTKLVVTAPKTIAAQTNTQPVPVSLQLPIKGAAKSSPLPAMISQGESNNTNKNIDTIKTDSNIAQVKKIAEVDRSKCEIIPQKAENVSPKAIKVDNLPPKAEIVGARAHKTENSSAKVLKIESISNKIVKEVPAPTKTPKKKDASPKTSMAKASETKKAERFKRAESTPKTPAEGERKSKRRGMPTSLYQSPSVEFSGRIPRCLTVTPRGQERLICFFKNEHLAVRNADNAFYICQLAQNVYRSSHKLKIRWLSPTEDTDTCEIFKPDYYDTTDFDCILTSVRLEKVDRSTFRLLPAERDRILNILKRALDKEKGIDTSRDDLAEDHPDGLDITLYKDEAQLKKKKSKRSPRSKRAPSEETTDEDSEEMKDLGDDSEDEKYAASESEHSESEEEVSPTPKVKKTPARRTPRGGRSKAPSKKPEPVKASTPRVSSTRNKRSAAAAGITESSTTAPPAKVARTLRQPLRTPAKQTKSTPKTTRRTRK